jgi:hypothetical protein
MRQGSGALRLLYMTSSKSGFCRRVEGFVATVLTAGGNHDTFDLRVVPVEERPDVHHRLQVTNIPALLVVEGNTVVARADGLRSKDEIGQLLAPWLRGGYQGRNRQPPTRPQRLRSQIRTLERASALMIGADRPEEDPLLRAMGSLIADKRELARASHAETERSPEQRRQ